MLNNVSEEQFMDYARALTFLANGAMAARSVALVGVETFDGQIYRPQLLAAYRKMHDRYEQIAANLLVYSNNNGIPFETPGDITRMLRSRYGSSVTMAAIEDCWYEIVAADLNSVADLLNVSLSQSDTVFQQAITLAAEALRVDDRDMIDMLFQDGGILYEVAYYKILIQMRTTRIQYPNGLVLKQENVREDIGSMPLVEMDLSNPHLSYMPPSFIFMTLENENGQFREGTKTTMAFMEGTLINPDSYECDRMIEDVVHSWLSGLRKDNNVNLQRYW